MPGRRRTDTSRKIPVRPPQRCHQAVRATSTVGLASGPPGGRRAASTLDRATPLVCHTAQRLRQSSRRDYPESDAGQTWRGSPGAGADPRRPGKASVHTCGGGQGGRGARKTSRPSDTLTSEEAVPTRPAPNHPPPSRVLRSASCLANTQPINHRSSPDGPEIRSLNAMKSRPSDAFLFPYGRIAAAYLISPPRPGSNFPEDVGVVIPREKRERSVMRVTRAFLVGASVLTVSLGTTTASQALGWERPWAAHTQSSTRSPAHDEHGKGDDKSHKEVKLNKYNLHHSCKGRDFGFCTQNLTFAPKILGDIGVTTGLIGLAAPAAAAPAAAAPAAAAPAAAAPAAAANPGEPEWCSPGYWRNHPESWVGYNPALTAAGGGNHLQFRLRLGPAPFSARRPPRRADQPHAHVCPAIRPVLPKPRFPPEPDRRSAECGSPRHQLHRRTRQQLPPRLSEKRSPQRRAAAAESPGSA